VGNDGVPKGIAWDDFGNVQCVHSDS
jgi:hypothetical protein